MVFASHSGFACFFRRIRRVFLATEAFMDPSKSTLRPEAVSPSIRDHLDSYLDQLSDQSTATSVNSIRQHILNRCREAAPRPLGFFTLAVPTGGGKTLSSMSFALRHVCEHDLQRVIVAIPFTSIIEQNVQVYQRIFSDISPHVVLEHHSNLEPDGDGTVTSRLQSENWDAPIVVTTNVQFYESLFAAKTSRCRKLHRIAKSVIILDEVQSLPVELLQPTLYALRELVDVYGCTCIMQCNPTSTDQATDFPHRYSQCVSDYSRDG